MMNNHITRKSPLITDSIVNYLETHFPIDPSGNNPKGFEICDDRIYLWTSDIENRGGRYSPREEGLFQLLENEGLEYDEEFHGYLQLDVYR